MDTPELWAEAQHASIDREGNPIWTQDFYKLAYRICWNNSYQEEKGLRGWEHRQHRVHGIPYAG